LAALGIAGVAAFLGKLAADARKQLKPNAVPPDIKLIPGPSYQSWTVSGSRRDPLEARRCGAFRVVPGGVFWQGHAVTVRNQRRRTAGPRRGVR
jgi:hypothetical protein